MLLEICSIAAWKKFMFDKDTILPFALSHLFSGVNDGWSEWAIALPGFGRRECIEAALLLYHPA